MRRTILALSAPVFVAALLIGSRSATTQENPKANYARATSEGEVSIDSFNSRFAVKVASNARFNLGAFPDSSGGQVANSWDLMYRWPNTPSTSFSTLRIDGIDSRYGSSGVQLEAPTDINSTTNRSKWQIGDIEVTQTIEIVFNPQTLQNDVAKISYTTRNTGSVSHNTGLRVMIDTEINYNDGAPFRVPGTGIVTTERDFIGSDVPDTFQTFFNVTDSTHVAVSTLRSGGATAPDRLVLARWPGIQVTSYDYNILPDSSFTSDSAYALYWNPSNLAAGASRTYTTFYGLADLQVDLMPPLALGVSAPATLSVVNGQYSPNPFDVTATVFNNGNGTANSVALSLNLPAGLSLASGSATQAIGDLAPGQERQVSWSVRASQQNSQTILTFSVAASASNAQSKTVQKQITLNALPTDVEVLGIEVTQGLQDLGNTNDLFIRGRRIFVRAHARALNQTLSNVQAELVVKRLDTNATETLRPFNDGKALTKIASRQMLDSSFNFELPRSFRDGLLQFRFRVKDHTISRCGVGGTLDNGDCLLTLSRSFQAPTVLNIDLVPIRYRLFTHPEQSDLFRVLDELESALPVFLVNWQIKPGISRLLKPTTSSDFESINRELEANRKLDCQMSQQHCGRYQLGVLINPSATSVLGMANNIPGTVASAYITQRFTPPHEMGHVLGREHTNYNGQNGISPAEGCGNHPCTANPADGTISNIHDDTGFFGWDLINHASPNSIYKHDSADIMSYGLRRWPSLPTWSSLYDRLIVAPSPPALTLGDTNAPVSEAAIILSGTVSLTQTAGTIESAYRFTSPTSVVPPPSGEYAIRFEDVSNQTLATYSFSPDIPSEGSLGSYVFVLPFNANSKKITLLKNGQPLASRSASTNSPVVTVTSPNGGESLTGTTANVTWTATDADGGPLTYLVQYSQDAGGTWQTLASNLTSTTYQLDLTTIPGTAQGLIRVLAGDGFNTSQDQSNATFTVARHAPLAHLQVPSYNRVFGDGQIVTLEGSGYDVEDGPLLQDTSFSWTSDQSGNVGTGRSLSLNSATLAPGYHRIALTVKDSDNQTSEEVIYVYVWKTPAPQAIDDARFFVTQHYLDFLNRPPDPSGLAFWTNQITECGTNAACVEVRRINVSAAYFLSIEFQETGYLVYRTYKVAYGNLPNAPVPLRRDEFIPDTQEIGKGVIVGVGDWQSQLESNKVAYAQDFVARDRVANLYPPTLAPAQFVDALFANGGVTPTFTDRNAAIDEFGGATNTVDNAARGRALRRVSENSTLARQETNKAFVLMQYFGYLQRNPNDSPEAGLNFDGYNFWLNKLNQFNGNFVNAEMVKAFIVSGEYKQRFGP
jgi:hypothetical protein